MLVTLRGGALQATLDIGASVSWNTTESGEFGVATLTVPRDSAAWNLDVVLEDGGFLVDIMTQFGAWTGVADRPQWRPAGMRITVHHIHEWLSLRLVGRRAFAGVTAGAIAYRAVQDALAGHGTLPITAGAILQAPPVIPLYEFDRQPLMDVLTDLHERTGQSWWLDRHNRFVWGNRQGQYRERTFVDDGRLFQHLQPGTLVQLDDEVIEVEDGGREFSARGSAPLLWPRQRLERI